VCRQQHKVERHVSPATAAGDKVLCCNCQEWLHSTAARAHKRNGAGLSRCTLLPLRQLLRCRCLRDAAVDLLLRSCPVHKVPTQRDAEGTQAVHLRATVGS
jgi:hypothetical protein